MADFKRLEDVQRWVDGHRGDAEYLRKVLSEGRLSDLNASLAEAWLERYDAGRDSSARTLSEEREERATKAAEASADATVDSAKTARRALAVSRAALWIALAALVISAWPFISQRLSP